MSKKYTILIIDDLSSSVKMIESFLREYNVISAKSGVEGLLLAQEHHPDLILLDVIMPKMSGFEVCEILKSDEELKDIPVIFLTTCNRRYDIDKSFDIGAFDYITKPISGKALRAKIHAVFSILDRIKLRKIEEYDQKSEANDIFVKGMSHNFNNMFGGIIGMAQLLENLQVDEPKVKRYARMIRITSENGAKLVSQLLEFSQRSDFVFERVDIAKVLERAINFITEVNSKIEIKTLYAANRNMVIGDAEKLFHVFRNLLINANEAMGDNPELIIRTKNQVLKDVQVSKYGISPGEYLKISIQDNGYGISEEIMGKIYEPFFSTSDLSEAKGLGLAEARGIIQGHHGSIDHANRAEGGAEFNIFLPLGKPLKSALRSDSIKEALVPLGKILLVDDEDISLLFAQEMLRKSGYRVETAVNGEEALKLYKENGGEFDLVLTDIIMPVMNGIELAEGLKEFDVNVKIIFMTGHSIDLEGKNVDFVKAVMKKPFRGAEIINVINNVLNS